MSNVQYRIMNYEVFLNSVGAKHLPDDSYKVRGTFGGWEPFCPMFVIIAASVTNT